MSDTPEALVKSIHQINGIITIEEKLFMTEADAVEYAENLKCVSFKVLTKDKGIVLYQNPNILEYTD